VSECPAADDCALARLLRLGVRQEAIAALVSELERQAVEQRAGRASLHVDSPPSGRPASVLVEGADGAGKLLRCERDAVGCAQERRER
jgi:hypothetical protein